jgi:hypothetical protein
VTRSLTVRGLVITGPLTRQLGVVSTHSTSSLVFRARGRSSRLPGLSWSRNRMRRLLAPVWSHARRTRSDRLSPPPPPHPSLPRTAWRPWLPKRGPALRSTLSARPLRLRRSCPSSRRRPSRPPCTTSHLSPRPSRRPRAASTRPPSRRP